VIAFIPFIFQTVPILMLSALHLRPLVVLSQSVATWNSLPDDLQDPAPSFDSFRRQLKTTLFSEH